MSGREGAAAGPDEGLRVEGLDVALGRTAVVRGASFTARCGEVVGLIGPNGAGKRTLLRALAGLVPAGAGAAAWNGRSLLDLAPKARARALAYLPQGRLIHWPMAVQRLVELGRLPRLGPLGRPGPADAEAVRAAMAATDTLHLASRTTDALSGGEQARVLLARALAVEAPLLLADEPTASLDPYHVLEVMAALRRVAGRGRAVVAVLHDLTAAAQSCDRLVLMDGGCVVAEGPPEAVLTPGRLRVVYRVDGGLLAGERMVRVRALT